jgi:hypothetical protein
VAKLCCDAFAKVSDRVAQLRDRAAEEGKVVAISARA